MDPTRLTLQEQSRLLHEGRLTPLELVNASLERIETHEPRLHCLTQLFADEARERAQHLMQGAPTGRLWGIPWIAKDVLATRLGRTTCGSRMLQEFRSPFDATVVERLDAAGAVLLGKSNMDEFAMGSSTENSAFGHTCNPWNPGRVPGGSSGGSAAAIAADYASFALGSDTGGSIRQPAGFCGVVGLKPTYGRVSRYGLVAFASSLEQIGPIAKTTQDAAWVLECIAGHDPRDSTSLRASVSGFEGEAVQAASGLRFGVPLDFIQDGMEPAAWQDFDALLKKLVLAGAEVVGVDLPHARHAVATYYIVATAEASSNLARYDGVRYGCRTAAPESLGALYERTRSEGFGTEVKRRILLGTFVLSSGYYEAYYLRAQKVRTLLRRDFERAFEKCDLVLLPTSPGSAFELGERLPDPLAMYLSDVFTVPANLTGLPAMSIPTGIVEGLPLGVQLYAPPLEEERLLRIAAWTEGLLGFQRLGIRDTT